MARRGGRIRLRVSINDVILFLAIGYSVLVIVIKWSKYERCSQPLHWFLLADYFLLLLARSTMYTKYLLAEGSPWHRLVYLLKFAVLFPCFVAWTIVGTVWFSQSGRCLPDNNQYWAFVVWLALCYLAISVLVCYVSFRLAMGLDPGLDQMATNQDFSLGIMRYMDSRRGLPREEIFRIRPFAYAGSADVDVPDPLARFAPPPNEDVCSICIEPFKKNQLCKRIPACAHMFHAPCLNKWLTTQGFCPVCRATVIAPAAHAEQVPGAELEAATAAHAHDDYAITVSRPEVDVPSTPELLSILESVSTPEVSVSHIDPSDPALDEPQLETESKGADDCIVNDDEQSQRTGEPMV